MNDLSTIEPNEAGWVNARALHEALGVKTRYADWVKRRLLDNNAKFGSDYTSYQSFEKRNRRRGMDVRNEYLVSVFMAEHFAMMENTANGKKVREVYIKCRRRFVEIAIENARLERENEALKAVKTKRLKGRTQQTIIHTVKTVDIFGNEEITVKKTRKYVDEMSKPEQKTALLQHLSRVNEGVSKRIRKEMNFEDIKPQSNTQH